MLTKRITMAEHDVIVNGYKEKITAMAALTGADTAEQNPGEMVEAITAALTESATRLDKIEAIEASLATSQAEFAGMKELAETHEATIAQANGKVESISALFGEAAKAADFDLVKAVGDLTPEGFTGSDPAQQSSATQKDETWSELDELAEMNAKGEISDFEFRRKARQVKPDKLSAAK
jgi:hypothetical protein